MITAALVNANTTPKLLRLIEGGRLDPTPFATHHLPLAETEAAHPAETRTLVGAGATTHQQRSTTP